MLIGNLNGYYRRLLVAPVAIKRTILKLIDREIAKGPEGRITLKCNSVTERDIIDRLAKASQAGVQVRMNIRGICCMLPGIEGKTDNIHVRSIVGQFLEHSRIFVFGEGDDMRMYVGSADLMTRNLVHRVEVAVPITTRRAREAIMLFLDKIFEDNVKARTLEANGEYTMVAESRDKDMCPCEKSFSMQEWCIDHPMQGVKREAPASWSVRIEATPKVESKVEPDIEPELEPEDVPDVEIDLASSTSQEPKALEEADIKLLAEGDDIVDEPVAEATVEVDLATKPEESREKKSGKKKDKDKFDKKEKGEKKEKSAKKSGKKDEDSADFDLPFISTKPAHSAKPDIEIEVDEGISLDDQPLGKHYKPSKKSEETLASGEVPVSTESTKDRLARERAYMSDFPHTSPRSVSDESEATAAEKADGLEKSAAQHEAPKKKGWFRSLFS